MNIHNDGLKEAAEAALLTETEDGQIEQQIDANAALLEETGLAVDGYSRTIEEVGTGIESLESYVSRFMGAVPEGEWNKRIARQYDLGMGAMLAGMGVSVESATYSESFEAVGTTQTGEENREKTKAKSEGLLKRLLEALKAAINSFITAVSDFVDSLKRNSLTIRNMGLTLRRIANITTGATSKTEFDNVPSWADYLHQGSAAVTPEKSLADVGRHTRDLTESWQKSFIAHAGNVLSNKGVVEGGGYISQTSFNGLPQNLLGEWPGLKVVKLDGDTFGDVSIVVIDSATKNTTKPKVLSLKEVKDLGEALIDLGSDLMFTGITMRKAVTEVKRIQSQLKLDDADKVSPAELGKLLSRMVQPYRTLAKLNVVIAKDAYSHGKASLALYK